jgi:hypothetical protein
MLGIQGLLPLIHFYPTLKAVDGFLRGLRHHLTSEGSQVRHRLIQQWLIRGGITQLMLGALHGFLQLQIALTIQVGSVHIAWGL